MRRRKGPSPGRNQRPAQALPTRATPSPKTPFEREQTTKRRGEISELAFALAAARQGFGISRPYGDSERYDIILDPTHLTSVISTETERKRAKWRTCSEPAEGDLLFAPARPRLVRVQVKSSTQLQCGLYRVNTHRRLNGRAVPYTLAEIDFFAAYVIPEDSWFIFPLPHILGLTSLLLSPKKRRRPGLYDNYRKAWPLLRQPDGLEFA
ncbi:MAG: group I intron-associated PD-(D/E)XK endonuclease [Candidatus Sulfotelmatobacter sp.]